MRVPTLFLLSLPALLAQLAPVAPLTPYQYANPVLPPHFSTTGPGGALPVISIDSTPNGNPTTDAGARLGRVLFYERQLSRNNTVSCASCHVQETGFSDPRRLSTGFAGGQTPRHSMGIADSRWNRTRRAFWDERAVSLEQQALQPIQDEVEMGLTLDEMIQRLTTLPYYPQLFRAAFGDPTVTPMRVAHALGQFQRSIISTRSRYDQGRALVNSILDPFPNFTAEENRGKSLFALPRPQGGAGCITCHSGEVMTNNAGPQNNGLDADSTTDLGAFTVTGLERHRGAFRVPSLRNVAARAPYMHDGRFPDLNAVIDFYNNGVQPHPQLDPALRQPNGQPIRLGLNPADRQALVRFLETLTDTDLLSDPRFSNPFSALVATPAASFQGDAAASSSLVSAFANLFPPNPRLTLRDADGREHTIQPFFGTQNQLNFEIPANLPTGWASLLVQGRGAPPSRGSLEIVPAQPALFSAAGDGRGAPAGYLVELLPDGSTRRTLLSAAPINASSGAVLELYGTGFRFASGLTATLGGASAEILYAGPQPDFPGLDQLNLRLPANLSGELTLRLTAGARQSNSLTLRFP